MTSEFSDFAARLRENYLLNPEGEVPRRPNLPTDRVRASCNSALRGDDELNSFAIELFALQFRHNAPYRKFCEARRASPRNIFHWGEIPAVPTSAFKELELSCLPPGERATVFHSSGTTEQKPSRHFHNAESVAVYEASLWPWFATNVLADSRLAIGDWRLAILTPPPQQAPTSSLVHMFETIRRKLGADDSSFLGQISGDGSWTIDFAATLGQLKDFSDAGKPVLLLGTAFSFIHLLDFLAEKNLRFTLPAGSRAMETGGYKGRSRSLPKAELHALITQRLGIPPSHIICEYGMSELSSQAYDTVVGSRHSSLVTRHFQFPPWSRAQIISPETGNEVADTETGLIRVFDLANVWSVMAIQTEDLGIRCGDGFELIGRAEFADPRGCSLMTA